jgi:hypothetical protein
MHVPAQFDWVVPHVTATTLASSTAGQDLLCCAVLLCVQVSMLAPGSPAYVMLPAGTGAVRCLARQPLAAGSSSGSGLMAVATDKAGLIIAKPSTNNIIAT